MRFLASDQQDGARPEDHGAGRTHARASRLQALREPVAAQFALGHARIEALPLETRDVIRAGNGAITAADAFFRRPGDDAGFRYPCAALRKGQPGSTSRIEALHALAFHKGVSGPVFGLVELDDVAGEIVEVRRRLVQRVTARIGRSVIRLGTSSHTGLAANAYAGVIEQSNGGAGNGDVSSPPAAFELPSSWPRQPALRPWRCSRLVLAE